MRISIVTLFPALYEPFLRTSLVERAVETGTVSFSLEDLFSYTVVKERIDSPTFGPGPGMLLKPEVIEKAIEKKEAESGPAYKIFFSPQGKKLDQPLLKKLATQLQEKQHVMLLPARYEGMDARVEEHYADCVLSIGDYVLMGGDLPAMVLIEGMLRLIPGVVGKQESIEEESFSGPFVDYPEFTAPVEWKGYTVPEVIRSGNHKEINRWRRNEAARKTVLHHFAWLRGHVEKKEDRVLAGSHIPPHYAILMHDHVLLKEGREGTSSVTSLDIHDIARSACTYGLKKYFIVTPLIDQQKIVRKLLDFWRAEVGIEYNPQRHQALQSVVLVASLDEALAAIKAGEEKDSLLIATSAQRQGSGQCITYHDQEKVWSYARPVVFLLGTARGLAPSVVQRCDFLLEPLDGFSDFNHLSVRSAAAIIFDRWLGINPVEGR